MLDWFKLNLEQNKSALKSTEYFSVVFLPCLMLIEAENGELEDIYSKMKYESTDAFISGYFLSRACYFRCTLNFVWHENGEIWSKGSWAFQKDELVLTIIT